jgi:enamine deaminase RidA (YjgF/YER057c/UK114 family)
LVATGAHTVHTSGQVSIDEEGKLVAPGDLAAQKTQAIRNLGLALAAASRPWPFSRSTVDVR